MTEKTFTYKDPKFLNKLILFINGNRCELSLILRPDVDEFLEANDRTAMPFRWSSPIPEIERKFREKQYSDDLVRTLVMLPLCKKHGIKPFIGLKFDCYGDEPKPSYCGPRIETKSETQPFRMAMHPSNFVDGKKWYFIGFKEIKGESRINEVKQAVAGLVWQGYRVTSLEAELDPYTQRGEYVDYRKSRATMFASCGEIKIFGEIPDFEENFGEEVLLKKEPPALPGPMALEAVCEELKELPLKSGR